MRKGKGLKARYWPTQLGFKLSLAASPGGPAGRSIQGNVLEAVPSKEEPGILT